MCWMASCTAGSIPWLMLLIRADSFIGIRTMMGKFSPSLVNQLLSCPCLVRSLHTLARAGWNSKTERSRHPVGRNISQPLQSLRAGAMLPRRWPNEIPPNPHCFGIANSGSSGMLRRPPVEEIVFQKRANTKAAAAPAVGKLVLWLWLQTEKIFLLSHNACLRVFQGRRDLCCRKRAIAFRCPSSKRSPAKTAPSSSSLFTFNLKHLA